MKNKKSMYQVGDRVFKTYSTAQEYARIKGLEVKYL